MSRESTRVIPIPPHESLVVFVTGRTSSCSGQTSDGKEGREKGENEGREKKGERRDRREREGG